MVQLGTPQELFENPAHTFVGYFIGSPGMNLLPCTVADGSAVFAGRPVRTANAAEVGLNRNKLELGVRPEFVRFHDDGFDVEIVRVDDLGRYQLQIDFGFSAAGDAGQQNGFESVPQQWRHGVYRLGLFGGELGGEFAERGGGVVRVRHLRRDDGASRRYRLEGGRLTEEPV